MTSPARLPLTGTPVAGTGRRSARLAAWGSACLAGRVGPEAAVRAVTGTDHEHTVEPGEVAALDGVADLAGLLAALPTGSGLRLVLPVPGDPRGLGGAGSFRDAALEAGEAVRLQHASAGFGLAPLITSHGNELDGWGTTVCWRAYPAPPAEAGPRGSGRQAERDLQEALREATTILTRLDVARLDGDAAARLAALRGTSADPLPPGHPAGARALWQRAERLAGILDVAAADDGAAYDRATVTARRATVRELAAAVRAARSAAVNAPLEESPLDESPLGEL